MGNTDYLKAKELTSCHVSRIPRKLKSETKSLAYSQLNPFTQLDLIQSNKIPWKSTLNIHQKD